MNDRNTNVCLSVIYNHNYEKNIPIIERIYAGRFPNLFHLMPFYRGTANNVIGVYDSAFQFSGYVAQAYRRITNDKFSHYVFVSDDLMISPDITSENIGKRLCLEKKIGFSPFLRLVDSGDLLKWTFGISSYMNLLSSGNACEFSRFLPDKCVAAERLARNGLDVNAVVRSGQFDIIKRIVQPHWHNPYVMHCAWGFSWLAKLACAFPYGENLYPIAHGFSDLFAVPASCMADFAHYCGVFASARVFTEVAIPMAMMFSCDRVLTLNDIGLKGFCGNGGEKEREAFYSSSGYDYQKLAAEFPADHLFVHPVKLSMWKNHP